MVYERPASKKQEKTFFFSDSQSIYAEKQRYKKAMDDAINRGLEIEPEKPIAGSGFERRHNIPKYLPDAIKRIKVSDSLSEVMGKEFITLFADVKQTEHDAYQDVISAWERDHLLLNV